MSTTEEKPAEVQKKLGNEAFAKRDFDKAIEHLYDEDIATNLKLDLNNGTVFHWPVARPQAFIRSLVQVSSALRRAIQMVPSSFDQPWSRVHPPHGHAARRRHRACGLRVQLHDCDGLLQRIHAEPAGTTSPLAM